MFPVQVDRRLAVQFAGHGLRGREAAHREGPDVALGVLPGGGPAYCRGPGLEDVYARLAAQEPEMPFVAAAGMLDDGAIAVEDAAPVVPHQFGGTIPRRDRQGLARRNPETDE